jgi:CheY-like chemotaxis protein
VFILSIGLPDMDGYELARRLRTLPQTGQAVLDALTGYSQQHERERLKAAGFNFHLAKPADAAGLGSLLVQIN